MNKKLLVGALVLGLLLTLTAGAALAQGPNQSDPGASRLPQLCKSGQVIKWNGKTFVCADDSLTLPFAGNVNSNGDAFAVTNTGAGRAGLFSINNTANNKPALEVSTNGTGPALNAGTNGPGAAIRAYANSTGKWTPAIQAESAGNGDALGAFHSGTGGGAASFTVLDPNNIYHAIDTYTNGKGNAINAYNKGTGSAGTFSIQNAVNSSDVLRATTNGTGWTGSFTTNSGKGIYISVPSGNEGLNVASGTKNAVVATTNGARLLYTEESSQVWFTDYGFGRVQNGSATIAIDPVFVEAVNLDQPYHVFVQSYGDAELYVANRTRSGFEVRARDGAADVEFSYRLVAKRLGFEDKRLERAAWADGDPNLYPGK